MSNWGKAYARKADKWSERLEWYLDAAEVIRMLPREFSLLDVGCSTGKFTRLVKAARSYARVQGYDVNLEALKMARKAEPEIRYTSSYALLYGQNFDFVVCMHSLIQMREPITQLEAMRKCLKSSGKLILLTHNPSNEWVWKIPNLFNGYKPDTTINKVYSEKELREMFDKAGLKVESVAYKNAPTGLGWLKIFNRHIHIIGVPK